MWGQVYHALTFGSVRRIIPTRVGTSACCKNHTFAAWDHPHACGDKAQPEEIDEDYPGSSPRVWGQADICDFDTDVEGIIPTRVGTRGNGFGGLLLTGDHPHACGDKQSLRVRSVMPMGSSPRVWGQALVGSVCPSSVGIIPTRVGTRHTFHFSPFIIKDHPHACGDKEILEMSTPPSRGSSPRVWGQE